MLKINQKFLLFTERDHFLHSERHKCIMKNNNFISEVPGQILQMGRGEKTKIVYSQSNTGAHPL